MNKYFFGKLATTFLQFRNTYDFIIIFCIIHSAIHSYHAILSLIANSSAFLLAD